MGILVPNREKNPKGKKTSGKTTTAGKIANNLGAGAGAGGKKGNKQKDGGSISLAGYNQMAQDLSNPQTLAEGVKKIATAVGQEVASPFVAGAEAIKGKIAEKTAKGPKGPASPEKPANPEETESQEASPPLATMPDPETQTAPIEAALAEVQQTEDKQPENPTSSTPTGPAVDNDNNNTPGPQNR